MAISFDLEVAGDRLVSRELKRFGDRGLDASPAFHVMAGQMRRQEALRFGSRGFGTWSPLQPSTIQSKARAHLDPRVLHATLRLRNSLTKANDPEHVETIDARFMVFGTKVPYARFHQRGEGVPTRKPVGFTETGKRQILRTLQRFIVTGEA